MGVILIKKVFFLFLCQYPDKTTAEGGNKGDSGEVRPICIPEPQHEVKKTAAERHRLGQMSPYVNQVLNKGEIKLPVLLEGENFGQLPQAHDVFRPLRQNIYAVLFNLHHARYTKKSMEDGAKKCNKEAQALRNTAEVRPAFTLDFYTHLCPLYIGPCFFPTFCFQSKIPNESEESEAVADVDLKDSSEPKKGGGKKWKVGESITFCSGP